MKKYRLKYGTALTEIELPAEDVIQVISPNKFGPESSDPLAVIRHALANPIDSPPLSKVVRPGEKACIVVNDITRLTKSEVFIPVIVNELNSAGISDADITILYANGLHRLMNEEEKKQIVGENVYGRVKTIQNDGIKSKFAYVGTTSRGNQIYVNKAVIDADKVILTGGIIMHHLAGYGGGRKSIIPGVAKKETVLFNHRMMVDARAEAGHLEGNPIHEDAMEGCALVAPDFLFNVVLDHQGKIAGAVAGHWLRRPCGNPALYSLSGRLHYC